MTQIAFLKKADIPTNRQIEEIIQQLGYDFKILNEPDKKIEQGGLDCSINGYKTYVETYIDTANSAISENEADWIIKDITHEDTAISFMWGADCSRRLYRSYFSCVDRLKQCFGLLFR